jgi:hypothetical protein
MLFFFVITVYKHIQSFQTMIFRTIGNLILMVIMKKGFFGPVEIPDHTFEMGAMLNRFSTDIAKGDVCYPQRMADS